VVLLLTARVKYTVILKATEAIDDVAYSRTRGSSSGYHDSVAFPFPFFFFFFLYIYIFFFFLVVSSPELRGNGNPLGSDKRRRKGSIMVGQPFPVGLV